MYSCKYKYKYTQIQIKTRLQTSCCKDSTRIPSVLIRSRWQCLMLQNVFVLLLKIMALFLMGGDSIPWSIWHLYLRSCSVFGFYNQTTIFVLFFGICNFLVFYIICIMSSVSSDSSWCWRRCWDWCVKLAKGHVFVYVVNKTWPQILIRWHQKLISWHQFKPGTKN